MTELCGSTTKVVSLLCTYWNLTDIVKDTHLGPWVNTVPSYQSERLSRVAESQPSLNEFYTPIGVIFKLKWLYLIGLRSYSDFST